jgi:threonine/homoserine/homoserine lactone efflux protein
MERSTADLLMILVGATSAALLALYALTSAANDPVFWLFVVAFIVYIGWDILRHLRSMRPQPPRSV